MRTDKTTVSVFHGRNVVPEYSRLVCENNLIRDGKVFQKKAGRLAMRSARRKQKKMRAFMGYPVKKLYPSLKQYAEDYCGYTFDSKNNAYGYYCNPNAFWIGIPLAAAGRSNSLSVTQRNELTVSAHGATKMLYVKRPKAIYGSAAQEKGILHGSS